MHKNHSVLCITPPHMLREIITNGSAAQRDLAMLTLTLSEQMRGQRKIMREIMGAMSFAIAGDKERIVYDAKFGSQLPGIPNLAS